MSIIYVKKLTKIYGPLSVRVLGGINLDFEQGAWWGKTTLLNILGALDRPTAGKVVLNDLFALREKDLYQVRSRVVGFVFQLYHLIPALKAWENRSHDSLEGGRETGARMSLVGIGRFGWEDRLPAQLSGGEQQRVAIARALVLDLRIPLKVAGRKILSLMQRLNQELRKTILIATHDPEVVAGCSTVVRMEDGNCG